MDDKKMDLVGRLDNENVVSKARPLSLMRCVPFSLEELKVLDVYLSRINSRDPKRRTVAFAKSEYEQIMGIEKTNLATLKKYTKGLLGKVVEIPMPEGYIQFVLFTRAEVKNDEYGVPTVYLTCTDEAQQLFFNIERIGYLRYEVGNALTLCHKSSYLLYLEVLRERWRGRWNVSVRKLRDDVFDLKNQESYRVFHDFRRYVLDPSVREINERTDVNISYMPMKHGRTVAFIVFIYHGGREMEAVEASDAMALPPPTEEGTDAQSAEDVSQSEGADLSDALTADSCADCADERDWIAVYGSQRLCMLAGACAYEFTREDMEALEACLPRELDDTAACSFLRMLYTRMCAQAQKQPIPHRAEYLQAMARKEPIPKRYVDEGARAPRVKKRSNASFTTEDLEEILRNA